MHKSKQASIIFSFLFIFFFNSCYQKVSLFNSYKEDCLLFDYSNKRISQKLETLLEILNIKHNGSLKNVVKETQKTLIRPAGKERWEIEDSFKNKQDKINPILVSLGLIKTIKPKKQIYDYVLFLGGTVDGTRNRLSFLIDLWNSGVRCNSLVILTGDRVLDPNIENEKSIFNINHHKLKMNKNWKIKENIQFPKTETDMIKIVFEQTELPNTLKNVETLFADSKSIFLLDGTLRRPNTGDTIKEWLKYNPKPGSCLVISSQPSVGYQHEVVKSFLPNTFEIETVGSGVGKNIKISVILDSLARWLYQLERWTNENTSFSNT